MTTEGATSTRWLTNSHPGLRRGWLPIAWSHEVDEAPRRFWLLGEPYVALRNAQGPTVLPDRCPHRLAPLSAGTMVDGQLRCAYHGWCFDGAGRCVAIPSLGANPAIPKKAHLAPPFGVQERYGILFVALDEPVAPLIDLPVSGDPATRRPTAKDFGGRFGAALLIDNQLDASHFAFVHTGTFGHDSATEIPPYEVLHDPDGWGFSVTMTVAITAGNDPGVAAGLRSLDQHRTMTYRYRAPFQLALDLEYSEMGGSNRIAFFAQPERDDQARMFSVSVLDQPGGFTDEEFAARQAFENLVGEEDRRIQGAFDVLALPLAPDQECPVRADRASVAFRRILSNLAALAATTPSGPAPAGSGAPEPGASEPRAAEPRASESEAGDVALVESAVGH